MIALGVEKFQEAPPRPVLEEAIVEESFFPTSGVEHPFQQEKKRLQENAALGKQVTAGETPTIKRKRGGILDGLF